MAHIGIDLGTTNSLAAVWKDGETVLIPNIHGEFLTPSVVSVDDDNNILIGKTAKERLVSHPKCTIACFKRLMGTSEQASLNGMTFSPEELSSLVLRQLKDDAEAFLGESVDEAVISVPAYFNDNQRNATKVAAQLAGINVERLINEPTAAAVAYGVHESEGEKHFIVLDLGGGTFDVSIMEKFDDLLEVHASAGDSFLGGEDFTEALMRHVLLTHDADEKALTPADRGRLYRLFDDCKRRLSDHDSVSYDYILNGEAVKGELRQSSLVEIYDGLLKRMLQPVERAVRDAGLDIKTIDDVFLVGGATRMPAIRHFATRLFGRFPSCHINPDHVVATGAAIQAALKQRNADLKDIILTDVSPFSLGIECGMHDNNGRYMSGLFSVIIERNTTIPASRVEQYVTVADGQKQIELKVYQGEHRLTKNNVLIGELEIAVPASAAGKEAIDVRFTYDVNGLLEVMVTVVSTQKVYTLIIENSDTRLSQAEIDASLRRLSGLKVPPREQEQNRALLARAERLFEERLGRDRDHIGAVIMQFESVLSGQDPRLIEREAKKLEDWLNDLEKDFWNQ